MSYSVDVDVPRLHPRRRLQLTGCMRSAYNVGQTTGRTGGKIRPRGRRCPAVVTFRRD
jgi:hypothetical protein